MKAVRDIGQASSQAPVPPAVEDILNGGTGEQTDQPEAPAEPTNPAPAPEETPQDTAPTEPQPTEPNRQIPPPPPIETLPGDFV